MARKQKKLGEILSRWGVVPANGLADALQYAADHGKRIGEALVELELCSEDDVYKALATQFDMPFVDLTQDVVTKSALDLVPHDLIRRHMVLPIGKEDNRIRVVITDPLDLDTIDMLRFRLNAEIETALAPLSKVKHFIDNFVDPMSDELSKSIASMSLSVSIDEAGADLQQIMEDEAEDAPIIRLINLMISEAVRSRASDIHVEPMADRVRVRYRIDGVCHVRQDVPKAMQAPMTTRARREPPRFRRVALRRVEPLRPPHDPDHLGRHRPGGADGHPPGSERAAVAALARHPRADRAELERQRVPAHRWRPADD